MYLNSLTADTLNNATFFRLINLRKIYTFKRKICDINGVYQLNHILSDKWCKNYFITDILNKFNFQWFMISFTEKLNSRPLQGSFNYYYILLCKCNSKILRVVGLLVWILNVYILN